jgi:hypothetical protein
LAIAAMSIFESARRFFAFSIRTDWILSRIESPAIGRKRISAMRLEHLNAVSASAGEIPSQARQRI